MAQGIAQEAFKKLEEQTNCAICLNRYTDPKQLQCHHVYCKRCLVKLVDRNEQGQLVLPCPTCRRITPIPANGVTGLQSAFQTNSLLEIYDSLKNLNVKDIPVASPVTNHCHVHNKELELYCETCEELICLECVVKGGKHHRHDSDLLEKVLAKCKDEFTSSFKPMEKQVNSFTKVLAEISTRCMDIKKQRVAIEADIEKTVAQLHETLDKRKQELVSELHQITTGKLIALEQQKNQVQTKLTQISSCLDFIKAKLNHGSKGEVVRMKTTIRAAVKRAKSLTSASQLKPTTDADITFSHSISDMTMRCQKYGDVSAPEMQMAYSSKCYAIGNGLTKGTVGERSTVVLHAVNFKGQPSERPIESLKCKLVSKMANTTMKVSTKKCSLNQYELSYQPTVPGKHQLHIKVEGKHIRWSPFTVNVLPAGEQDTTANDSVLTLEQVDKPLGVAINQRGEVVVTESGVNCVSVFSPTGTHLKSFGQYGADNGELNYPHGVAVDGQGNILVADCENHRIQKFTMDGKFLASAGNKEGESLQLYKPVDIALNSHNNQLYIVDECHRVYIVTSDLTLLYMFGEEGTGRGQFSCPSGIACSNKGDVYVVDNRNNRIQIFTAEGTFMKMFGSEGDEGQGLLNGPVGIVLDNASELVYVSDCNHQINVFTFAGEFKQQFCQYGAKAGELNYPSGLAMDNAGILYVCDNENYRLQYFSMHN